MQKDIIIIMYTLEIGTQLKKYNTNGVQEPSPLVLSSLPTTKVVTVLNFTAHYKYVFFLKKTYHNLYYNDKNVSSESKLTAVGNGGGSCWRVGS